MDCPEVIQWIDSDILKNKKVLIVDEVDDTGQTLDYIITILKTQNITDIAIAVLHNKKKHKKYNHLFTNVKYFSGNIVEDKWIVYQWDK